MLCLAQACQQGMHMRQIDFTFGLAAAKYQIQERVVRKIQQARQRIDFLIAQTFLMRI